MTHKLAIVLHNEFSFAGSLRRAVAATARGWGYYWHGKRWLLTRKVLQSVGMALRVEEEHQRFFLWVPVAALAGVLLFFAASHDPSAGTAVFLCGLSLMALFVVRNRSALFFAAVLACAVATGFLLATLRTEWVAAPRIERPMWLDIQGVVTQVEKRPRSMRLMLDVREASRLEPENLPRRVRVVMPLKYGFKSGDVIRVHALWSPPYPPARPEGYDFARTAFYGQIGAVGSRVKSAQRVAGDTEPLSLVQRVASRIEKVRYGIAERIQGILEEGDARAITIALVNGQRGEISKKADEDLRLAGLYHVISISGLHMALFAGVVFAVVRMAGVLIPGVVVRYPVKAWAALAACAAAFGYLLVSGSDIPAVRSFVMVALVFTAVVLGRTAITQRNLAFSAGLVILFAPEAVLGPSFQMSFAAVMLLIAWYEPRRTRQKTPQPPHHAYTMVVRWLWRMLAVAVITTVLATLATAPFAAYHFQRFAPYALAGNLLASPLVAIVIMPAALLGLFLFPFRLDGWAWHIMGWGVQGMLDISAWVARWPGADLILPAFPLTALLVFSFGLLWISLWMSGLRWLGILPMLMGAYLALTPQRMDFFIAPQGQGMAMRGEDGLLRLAGIQPSSLMARNWLLADGDARLPKDVSLREGVWCDRAGCTAPMPDGGRAAVLWSARGVREDCGKAAFMVTRLAVPPVCRVRSFVLDGRDLADTGAVSGFFEAAGGVTLHFAQPPGTSRLWYTRFAAPEGITGEEPELDVGDSGRESGQEPF